MAEEQNTTFTVVLTGGEECDFSAAAFNIQGGALVFWSSAWPIYAVAPGKWVAVRRIDE